MSVDERGPDRDPQGFLDVRDELAERAQMPLWVRLRAPDRYGVLLLAIIASIVGIVLFSGTAWERIVAVTLAAGTLLFALYTSRASRRVMRAALVLVPLLVIGVGVIDRIEGIESGAALAGAMVTLLCIVLVAIVLRLGTHLTISWTTVFGAVCIYLVFGLAFAGVYALIGDLSDGALFAQQRSFDSIDTLYYSFVTLTTIGYGDLTMADDLPRVLSAVEALFGQVYLVTTVGLLVGNLGRQRRRGPAQ